MDDLSPGTRTLLVDLRRYVLEESRGDDRSSGPLVERIEATLGSDPDDPLVLLLDALERQGLPHDHHLIGLAKAALWERGPTARAASSAISAAMRDLDIRVDPVYMNGMREALRVVNRMLEPAG